MVSLLGRHGSRQACHSLSRIHSRARSIPRAAAKALCWRDLWKSGRIMPGICRDCLTTPADGSKRCTACGSPRLVAHPALATLAIAHIDCDAFYAAIEKRDDPKLADH